MSVDLTGKTLANLMAAAGFGPPALPSNPSAAQIDSYNTAMSAHANFYAVLLSYLVSELKDSQYRLANGSNS